MRRFQQSHRVIQPPVPLVYLGEAGGNLTRVSWTTERWGCKKGHAIDLTVLSCRWGDLELTSVCPKSETSPIELPFSPLSFTLILVDSGCSGFAKLQTCKRNLRKSMMFSEELSVCFTRVDYCYRLQ